MARTCIYCDAPVSAESEHIIPRWLPQFMEEEMGVEKNKLLIVRQSPERKLGTGIPFRNYKARILCEECHDLFGDLESYASPLIKPMIRGGTQEFYRYWEARTIATWAAKTAFNVIARDGAPQQPEWHRHFLRRNGEPPPDCGVYAVPYDAAQIRVFSNLFELKGENFGASGTIYGYNALMAFGHVAFKVFGFIKRVPRYELKIPATPQDGYFAVPIWPPPGINWPSPILFRDSDLEILNDTAPFGPGPFP